MTAHKTFNWDYEVLGSIGYHQVGQPDAFEKRTIENGVLRDIMRLPQFQIPEELTGYVQLSIKRFSHDAGSYDELCLLYDWIQLEDWELSLCPQKNAIAERFYTWMDTMQCYDYESEQLQALCAQIYEQRNGIPPQQILTFNQAAL